MGMTTLSPAPAPAAVTVTIPSDDLQVVATLATDVITYLEAQWHAGACGCSLMNGCARYGDLWVDYAPVTWMPDAVIVALREVTLARAAETLAAA